MTYFPILIVLCHAVLVFCVCKYDPWPNPQHLVKVDNPQRVNKTQPFDGEMKLYVEATDQSALGEFEPPLFELEDGATIRNVVIGKKGADGIHCLGTCWIENCWWEDVKDDAASFFGGANDTYKVSGGGARNALNKVFQHDGGGTAIIENFQVENFAKVWESCGNCLNNSPNQPRKARINCVKAKGPGETIAGTMGNYGDSATINNIQVEGKLKDVCQVYIGNNQQKANPPPIHETAAQDGDGVHCIYNKSDITTSTSTGYAVTHTYPHTVTPLPLHKS